MLAVTSALNLRLCGPCRTELWRLFRFGFCTQGASIDRKLRSSQHKRDGNKRAADSERHHSPRFWGNTRCYETQAHANRAESENGTPPETSDRAQFQSQKEEVDSDRPIQNLADSIGDKPMENAIPQARAQGSSIEDIARMARQKFGGVLPKGILNDAEYKIYVRLYGEPDDVQGHHDVAEGESYQSKEGQTLFDTQGDVIRVNWYPMQEHEDNDQSLQRVGVGGIREPHLSTELHELVEIPYRSRMRNIAESLGGEIYEVIEPDRHAGEESESAHQRLHPLTTLGKFATSPRTVFLPGDRFIGPVEDMQSKFSNKHLKEVSLRTFGGEGLPDSALTPYSSRRRPQVPIPLEASQHAMGEMEANAFMSVIMPPVYASILSVLTEIRKRLGSSWLRRLIKAPSGPRILDAGAGGAAILAWNEIVRAEWALMNEGSAPIGSQPPASKSVVLTGSEALRHRAATLLENTTFVPRLPDYIHTRDSPTLEDSRPVQQRKQFDVVIAPHTLFSLKEDYERKQQVQNLWSLLSSEGGILILLEKGIPRGFEAIAGAREFLLQRYIASENSEIYESPLSDFLTQEEQITKKGEGMIIAPCTNHEQCPMYTIPGLSKGRKDFCSFRQRFIRPSILHRVMGGGHSNSEDVGFSYVAVMKGRDIRGRVTSSWTTLTDPLDSEVERITEDNTPKEHRDRALNGFEVDSSNPLGSTEHKEETASLIDRPLNTSASRIIFSPLKRQGHVSMDVCTPHGKIERWTVPKSFSKQAYHDARKAKWGDLWALGAKTAVARNLTLGNVQSKEAKKTERKKRKEADRAADLREQLLESVLADRAAEEEEENSYTSKSAESPGAVKDKVDDETLQMSAEEQKQIIDSLADEDMDDLDEEELEELMAEGSDLDETDEKLFNRIHGMEVSNHHPSSNVEDIAVPRTASSSKPATTSESPVSNSDTSSTTAAAAATSSQDPSRLLNDLRRAERSRQLAAQLREWEAEDRKDREENRAMEKLTRRRKRTRE